MQPINTIKNTEIFVLNQKSNLPQRRSLRLQGYDYSQQGAYFVTMCVQHRQCLFGEIIDGKMQLNEISEIVVEWWNFIPQHFPFVETYDFVIMPNHIHGIIAWDISVGTGSPHPKDAPTLGNIVGYFKYQSTKYINQLHNTPGKRIWQSKYYDHIIRDDIDLGHLREYIQNNPKKWELDQLHPDNKGR